MKRIIFRFTAGNIRNVFIEKGGGAGDGIYGEEGCVRETQREKGVRGSEKVKRGVRI